MTVVRKIEGTCEMEKQRVLDKFILEREGNTVEVNTSLFLGYNDWSGCPSTMGGQWKYMNES